MIMLYSRPWLATFLHKQKQDPAQDQNAPEGVACVPHQKPEIKITQAESDDRGNSKCKEGIIAELYQQKGDGGNGQSKSQSARAGFFDHKKQFHDSNKKQQFENDHPFLSLVFFRFVFKATMQTNESESLPFCGSPR
ncbi:MAG: hypothetical protein ACLFQ6_06660, partial [Candidatus Sumerlaeia bacterium]